ncbi:MAG: hypothetical protein ACRCWY_11865 [Cellulosilyticaceae bacterium]
MMDQLILKENNVVFQNAAGEEMQMPNLTALVKRYQEEGSAEVKERIRDILQNDMGTLLVVEIMMDMGNETTLKRLETGEISKTMKHVNTYYVILDSQMDQARQKYEELDKEGTLEQIFFAQFPYGMVIEREKFLEFQNDNDVKKIKIDIMI